MANAYFEKEVVISPTIDSQRINSELASLLDGLKEGLENVGSLISSGTEAAIRETVNKSSQTIKTEYTKLSNNLQNIGNEAFGNTFSDLLSGETDSIGDHVICPAIHSARGRAYGGTLVATSANR